MFLHYLNMLCLEHVYIKTQSVCINTEMSESSQNTNKTTRLAVAPVMLNKACIEDVPDYKFTYSPVGYVETDPYLFLIV